MRSFARPLSDHTPLVWARNVGHGKFMYCKLDSSWLRDVHFKEDVEKAGGHKVGAPLRQKYLPLELEGYGSTLWGSETDPR